MDCHALSGTIATTMPKLIYGTAWKKERTANLVFLALKRGFRGIDTAAQPKHYHEAGVSEGVRRAIAEGFVTRADLFVRRVGSSSDELSHSRQPTGLWPRSAWSLTLEGTDPNQVYPARRPQRQVPV